ncbi:MAG: hypothetical protein KBA95_02325 [Acidobacteria bacterium]|nr:hypothetical protein [Acidobacteriota bacterium]
MLAFVALAALASPAGATTIWLCREVAAVSAAVSLTGTAGDTYASSQTVFGALLGDPALSRLDAVADFSANDTPDGYLDLGLGSGASIREGQGIIEVNAATGYGECTSLACGEGSAPSTSRFALRRTPHSRRITMPSAGRWTPF